METELGSWQSAMRSLENAQARKIEQRLLTENQPDFASEKYRLCLTLFVGLENFKTRNIFVML